MQSISICVHLKSLVLFGGKFRVIRIYGQKDAVLL